VLELPDGRIAVRGGYLIEEPPDFTYNGVVRLFQPDGTPDVGFGVDGLIQFDRPAGNGFFRQSNGQLVIGSFYQVRVTPRSPSP